MLFHNDEYGCVIKKAMLFPSAAVWWQDCEGKARFLEISMSPPIALAKEKGLVLLSLLLLS
jgi:hypothetical protein